MTLVCVPITVEDIDAALADSVAAKDAGADLVEFRIDSFFHGSDGDAADAVVVAELQRLIAGSALPVVLTCRPTWEGGDYDGDDSDRVSLFEKLCAGSDHPPAYLDVEFAAYTRSANLRQKINLCVDHPKQQREVRTRLILSVHDFEQRPSDLMRKLADAWAEPAASVVKFAFRARSIRDNLEVFEILREAPKPTVGLCMGEFGLMSRVLAPKFGGYLTFASLRDSSGTAPGQPTMGELLGLYRFRSIGRDTRVYGVVGWPVGHSMSPLIHNAGFEARGWDGVYLPLPVADSDESFKATVLSLLNEPGLGFSGASVTIPHKTRLAGLGQIDKAARPADELVRFAGAANTLVRSGSADGSEPWVANTDASGAIGLLFGDDERLEGRSVCVIGAGGVARSIVLPLLERGLSIELRYRSPGPAEDLLRASEGLPGRLVLVPMADGFDAPREAYINCTPVGMQGGPAPDESPIDIDRLIGSVELAEQTVFFDTVYNPIDTPMLRAANGHGFRTIDGVQMFVRQAAAQFRLWTGHDAPEQLFDRLVRETLAEQG